jgi:hypothetical protein
LSLAPASLRNICGSGDRSIAKPALAAPGRSDWCGELESLVDCTTHDPALPVAHPFIAMQDVYWSSTTSLFEPDWAWALYLNKGAVGVGQKAQAHFHVWAVRD